MHFADAAAPRYHTVAEIRDAVAGRRCETLPEPNARVFRLRRRLGLSQAAMAERFGLSKSVLQKVELGQKPVPRAMLRAIDREDDR